MSEHLIIADMKPCRSCDKSGLVKRLVDEHPNPGGTSYPVERRDADGKWFVDDFPIYQPEPGKFMQHRACGDCGGFGYTGHPDDTANEGTRVLQKFTEWTEPERKAAWTT